jgi:hypothetical protein
MDEKLIRSCEGQDTLKVTVVRNRMVRRIFGPKRTEVRGGQRKLHVVRLHSLYYYSLNIIRVMKSGRMRWAGHVACMGEMRNLYRIIVGKPEILGRLRCRRGLFNNAFIC